MLFRSDGELNLQEFLKLVMRVELLPDGAEKGGQRLRSICNLYRSLSPQSDASGVEGTISAAQLEAVVNHHHKSKAAKWAADTLWPKLSSEISKASYSTAFALNIDQMLDALLFDIGLADERLNKWLLSSYLNLTPGSAAAEAATKAAAAAAAAEKEADQSSEQANALMDAFTLTAGQAEEPAVEELDPTRDFVAAFDFLQKQEQEEGDET